MGRQFPPAVLMLSSISRAAAIAEGDAELPSLGDMDSQPQLQQAAARTALPPQVIELSP